MKKGILKEYYKHQHATYLLNLREVAAFQKILECIEKIYVVPFLVAGEEQIICRTIFHSLPLVLSVFPDRVNSVLVVRTCRGTGHFLEVLSKTLDNCFDDHKRSVP